MIKLDKLKILIQDLFTDLR